MTKRYSFVAPMGGPNYDWSADHTYVKVSAEDTGGQYTLMEDNLKSQFALGLHLHRYHAETFYILEGDVDFYIDGDWMTATPGSCIHVPPGVPHACTLADGCEGGRMLMIYQPSGFDQYLAELAQMTEADFADTAKMDALNDKYDIVNLGPVPDRG
ncbi:cupin domain-containing protein [Pacificoceanicola onchidii]|uniref:cupin domain-containing protein n=1 Tax=Pacificoceanicola onchidii TaxID=2562685 RepID=UPI0010A4AD92|nr:cupin domain-containing protein [Pacificoceanicola onchidii]